MFDNFKADSDKQMSQVRKSIQGLDQKVSSVDQNGSKPDKSQQCRPECQMRVGSVDQNGSKPDDNKSKNTGESSASKLQFWKNNHKQTEVLKMKESINLQNQMETSSTDKMEKN